jgi:DNA repair exonuclease SbcCD ATPase subunit
VTDAQKEVEKLRISIDDFRSKTGDLLVYKEKIKQLQKRLEDLKNEQPDFDIETTRLEILELKGKVREPRKLLRGLLRELEVLDWLIKDPLSNTGIKAFIFEGLVTRINDKLQEYAKFIKFLPQFVIDMESTKKDIQQVIYKDEVLIPFPDLSGGQGQMINVANIFAAHDIVQDSKPTNILWMDEIFESLDEDDIELINELILSKSSNKSVFLVTHRKEFIPINAKVIRLKLVNSFTEIV